MSKYKLLITGGTGFIGSHLAELLAKKNFKVIVFDRYNINYNLGNLSNSKFKKGLPACFTIQNGLPACFTIQNSKSFPPTT